MDYNALVIIQNEKASLKLKVVKSLLIELITVPQNSVSFCALVNCNQPAMPALFEYSGSLA